MLNAKVLGIVFPNMHDENLGDMTELRSMGSMPFGGRYRMIDFSLSSLVAAGVTKVGVIAKSNYHSLMDHLGSGRAWDLSRKRDGLSIFPPNSYAQTEYYHGRIEALHNIIAYIKNSPVDYVAVMDCDNVCNLDMEEIVNYHIDSEAEITMVCRPPLEGEDCSRDCIAIKRDEFGRISEFLFNSCEEGYYVSMNIFIAGKERLIEIIEQAQSRMKVYFERDLLHENVGKMRLQSYVFEGFCRRIQDSRSYFEANMALLNDNCRRELFVEQRPVYTKVRDDAPVRYGLNAKVKNTLAADGCVILGEVENCLLFRGVYVGEGAVLKNCIVMQDTVIEKDSRIEYAITDKDVKIGESRSIIGHSNYPLYIKKWTVI
ncbi:MAG: glucose-1-phosphate adenylyltransferase subunit GlgD [Oscillospiraceae bacterium]|nr:glucose-1-phosphate adenylyltransferase subunit GlgD [Oscillospiraceae bacterium]